MRFTNEYKKAAYKLVATANVAKLTNDELLAAHELAEEMAFAAEMCDDYKVTCHELAEIGNHMAKANAEITKRGI